MRRLLVIVMLMAFVTGANASSEKQCKECESTWIQWFGATATLAMAYQYASSKIPMLEGFNTIAASKGAELASGLSVWAMAKWAGRVSATGKTN